MLRRRRVVSLVGIDESRRAHGRAQHVHRLGREGCILDDALHDFREFLRRLDRGDERLELLARGEVALQQQIGRLFERRVVGQVVDVVAAVDETAFFPKDVADRRLVGDDAFETLGGGGSRLHGGWHGTQFTYAQQKPEASAPLRLDQAQRHLAALGLWQGGPLLEQGAARPTGVAVRGGLVAAEDRSEASLLAVGERRDGALEAVREDIRRDVARRTLLDARDLGLDEEGSPVFEGGSFERGHRQRHLPAPWRAAGERRADRLFGAFEHGRHQLHPADQRRIVEPDESLGNEQLHAVAGAPARQAAQPVADLRRGTALIDLAEERLLERDGPLDHPHGIATRRDDASSQNEREGTHTPPR